MQCIAGALQILMLFLNGYAEHKWSVTLNETLHLFMMVSFFRTGPSMVRVKGC